MSFCWYIQKWNKNVQELKNEIRNSNNAGVVTMFDPKNSFHICVWSSKINKYSKNCESCWHRHSNAKLTKLKPKIICSFKNIPFSLSQNILVNHHQYNTAEFS